MKTIYLTIQLTLLSCFVKGQSFCTPINQSNITVSSTSACPNGVITVNATGGTIPAGAYYNWRAMYSPNSSSSSSNGIDFGQQGSPINVVNGSSFQMPATGQATYYIRLTAVCSNGVRSQASTEIAVTRVGPPTVSTPTPQAVFCPGTPVSISVASTGGLSYSWKKNGVVVTGANTQTISFASPTATNAGVYTCLVANGCGTVTSAAITFTTLGAQIIPGISTTATNTTKIYSIPNQSGLGVAYTWSLSGGGTITSATNTNSVSVNWANTLGTYTLSLTKTLGACQITDTKTVSVVACTTNTILVETNGNKASNEICANQNVAIGVFSAGNYTWSTTSNFPINDLNNGFATVTPTSTSTFLLTHIDNTGCAKTGSIEIIVNPLPLFSISATSTSVCANQSATLSIAGSSYTSYDWSATFPMNNDIPLVISPSVTTTYTANAYNGSTTCKSTQTIQVAIVANPVIKITVSVPNICAGESSTLTAGGSATSYTWSENSATTNSIVVSPMATTVYTLDGSNATGCVGTTQWAVNVNNCTGIKELDNSQFLVYPNPAKNYVTVESSINLSYEIYNSIGVKVAFGNINDKQNQIDISNFSKGVYIIQLNDGKIKGVKRMIKE